MEPHHHLRRHVNSPNGITSSVYNSTNATGSKLIIVLLQMFLFQTHYDEINFLVLIVMFMEVVFAYAWLLISCELGERFTAKFDEISFAIDQFKWYSFPISVKRMLPTIMIIAQQATHLDVFGSLTCLRDSFKKVS